MSCTGCQYHQVTGLTSSRCTYNGPCIRSQAITTENTTMRRRRRRRSTSTSIDVGLSALVKHANQAQTMTSKEIAEVCECHTSMIQDIERKALAKYKRFMQQRLGDYAIGLELQGV